MTDDLTAIARELTIDYRPAGEAFGVDDDLTRDWIEPLDVEGLLALDERLGEIAGLAGRWRQVIRQVVRDRTGGRFRIGPNYWSISKGYSWRVQSPEQFWMAVDDICARLKLGGIDAAAKLFNPNQVRVSALRALGKQAGVEPTVLEDTVLEKRWSESWRLSVQHEQDLVAAVDWPEWEET